MAMKTTKCTETVLWRCDLLYFLLQAFKIFFRISPILPKIRKNTQAAWNMICYLRHYDALRIKKDVSLTPK